MGGLNSQQQEGKAKNKAESQKQKGEKTAGETLKTSQERLVASSTVINASQLQMF